MRGDKSRKIQIFLKEGEWRFNEGSPKQLLNDLTGNVSAVDLVRVGSEAHWLPFSYK